MAKKPVTKKPSSKRAPRAALDTAIVDRLTRLEARVARCQAAIVRLADAGLSPEAASELQLALMLED